MDSFGNVGEKKKELKNSKYSKRKKRKIEVNEINRTSYSDTTAGSSTGLTEALGLVLPPPPLQGLPMAASREQRLRPCLSLQLFRSSICSSSLPNRFKYLKKKMV